MALEQDPNLNPESGVFNPVPKFGQKNFSVLPPKQDSSIGPNKPVSLAHTIVGKTAAETQANWNSYLTSKYDYNNFGKLTAFDAGPNGANLARYEAYGEETFNRIGFSPSIDNETKFNQGTTWWDDTKRMFTNSFLPLFGSGIKANLKSYVDIGRGDFGQDIRAAADYEKYSNIGYSSKSGVMPFISNTVMSYAYTAGILTEAIAEAYLLRKVSPSVFGGKDFLLSAPKNIGKVVKSGADYLGDVKNINAARGAFNNALKTGANFINPINHTWDNFVTNIYRNEENITNLARAQRTFGAFYKDLRNINMALSEAKLEGGFVENKMMNDLYNQHWFDHGTTPDEKTMELYQRKSEAAGFSATMQNAGLVFYTNKITLPTLMSMGPFKALDNVGRELTEGTLLKTGKGLKATTMYQKKNLLNSVKNLYNPRTWGKGGLSYFSANLMEGIQENLQDVIADSTQQYFTSTIFTPERGKFEMYSAALKDGFSKQWSKQGLETFASGFLMGFGNTITSGVVQRMLSPGYQYLKNGKAYINYLDERHDAGQELSDIVNAGLNPTKFFGSREFDHGNQSLLSREIESENTSEKEKHDTRKTSFISSVVTALDTGTFDMYVDNLQAMKDMTEVEIEDTFKLKAGEGKKALDRIDKIIERAKQVQNKYEYHQTKYPMTINPNDYKEGTIEREHADLMMQAHHRAKFNAIFLDSSYEDNVRRINKMGQTFLDFMNYTKSNANLMMSDLNAIYDREALKSEIKLLEAEVESAEGITDPAVVAQREATARKLERLKKYDKAQSDYDAVQQSKLDGSLALTEYLKKQLFEAGSITEEEKSKVQETDEKILGKIQEIENRYEQALKDYLVDLVGGKSSYEEALRKAEAEGKIDITDMFKMLKDIKKLDVENQAILRYVNVLKDPGGYYEHVQKNYKWMRALYANKKEHIRQMIEKSIQTKEYQDLLKSLSDDGVYIDLDEFAKWVNNKKYLPKEFIDGSKEIVIPKGTDRYMEYYSRFVKIAKAQEERIANEKINKEQSLKDRTEELDKMKQKELDDARSAYLKEIKAETGQSESDLVKARAAFEEQNKGNLKELQEVQEQLLNFLNLTRAVNSPALLAAFEQVKKKLIDTDKVLDVEVYNQLQIDAENIPEQFDEVLKIYKEKQKTLKGVSEEDTLLFSMDFYVISKMIQTKLDEISENIKLAESASENPNVDFKETKAYKLYQKRISEIEEKYKKALAESKEDIENFDDDAPRKSQINVATPWEQLPQDLVDILQPKFDAYVEGKDFPEEDLYDIRQNWLLTQNSTIQTYLGATVGTAEVPAAMSEKIPKLKTLPKDQQEALDKSDVSNLTLTVKLRRILQNKLDKKPAKGEAPLTKEVKAAIQADIDELQKYINYQRSVATPAERLRSIAEDFTTTLMELQKDVAENVVNGRRQNYILDQGLETETVPQRVTELTEDIELEINPEKPPYLYYGLKDPIFLSAIDQLTKDISEGTIRKDTAIEAFMTTMKALIDMGKLTQFASENKMNDIRGLLYMDAVKKGIMSKEEALLGLNSARLGKSQYAKDIEAYEAPEAKPVTPTTKAPVSEIDRKAAVKEAGLGRELQSIVKERLRNEGVTQEERNNLAGTEDQAVDIATEADYNALLENNNKKLQEEKDKFEASQKKEGFDPTTGAFVSDEAITFYENKIKSIQSIIDIAPASEQAITTDETDLEDFGEEEQSLNISSILNILSDVAHQESSDVGTTVDDMIREFLLGNEPKLPSYMTKNHPAYVSLFGPKGIITEIKDGILEGKYTILSDHVKVFDRNLGPKVNGKPLGLAGEVDLILIDNFTGEIEIIDIKTAQPKNWRYWDIDKKINGLQIKLDEANKKLEKESDPKKIKLIEKDIASIQKDLTDAEEKWSKKLNYSIQQTIYRNLIYRMTGKMPRAIKILPLAAEYTLDGIIKNVKLATSVVDTDSNGLKGTFITLEPVSEVNKYVPIGTVKETIETPTEEEFEETEVLSNQISNNIGKSFVYNGNTGVLIKTPEGTYALDTPTEVIEIMLNGNNKISPETTLETLALTPIKITERPFMTTSIDGVQYTLSELDPADDSIIINGVKYKVLRTPKTKKVNGVEFMSNQKAIEDVDKRIRELSDDLVKRKEEGSREGENVNQFLENTVQAQTELDILIGERSSLAGNNKIRKLIGTNAQDLIYIINQSPEIFLSDTSNTIEEENEDLDDIKSLFPTDAAFDEVYEAMKSRPESLDRIIRGEFDTISLTDMSEIRNWIENTISALSFSDNVNVDAINMLQTLNNELTNINFTKDGKIYKRSAAKTKSFFERQAEQRRAGAGVSNVQESAPGQAEGVSGQPVQPQGGITAQQGKEIVDSVRKTAQTTAGVQDLFGDLGTEEVEGYEEIRDRIMKATEEELEDIQNDLFQKAIRNEITINEEAINQLIEERKFQLQENVTVQDVKKNQTVVAISTIINEQTSEEMLEDSIFKVTKVNEKEVTLQSLDNKTFKVTMTASQFNKKFKPYMKKTTKKAPVAKPITKEYKEVSLDVAEELENFAQNQANIADIQETFGDMTEDEADNAFLDAVKQCKTK